MATVNVKDGGQALQGRGRPRGQEGAELGSRPPARPCCCSRSSWARWTWRWPTRHAGRACKARPHPRAGLLHPADRRRLRHPDEAGKRLMKVPCLRRPTRARTSTPSRSRACSRSIDLDTRRRCSSVVDTGVVPVPADAWGYTAGRDRRPRRQRCARRSTRPTLAAAGRRRTTRSTAARSSGTSGASGWRVDKRPGVVLSQIDVKDGERLALGALPGAPVRGVRALHGPDRGLVLAHLHGQRRVRLRHLPDARCAAGVDCPAYATFLPAPCIADDSGQPARDPERGLHLRAQHRRPGLAPLRGLRPDPGDAGPRRGPARRPSSSSASASEVGNYDYLIDYVFQQNGMIRVMVGATGLDAVKGVASTSMNDPTAAEDTALRHADRPEPRRAEPRPLLQLPPRLRRRRPGQHASSAPALVPRGRARRRCRAARSG